MKMVKSLLLGTAAGFVAIAGAQAADLPVKAKPVQYVKICSLYGAGFYYIPGTDMCLKIGGWVRLYAIYGGNTDSTNAALDGHNANNRTTGNFSWKSRGYITADARNQTEYGTVRSYIAVGLTGDDNAAFSANRAFVQFAGFTFGLSQSFYDFYSQAAVSFYGGRVTPASDTGDAGQTVWGYTAQLGNGLSATVSAEAQGPNRNSIVWNTAVGGPTPLANAANSYEGAQWPDFVANLRVDQPWGSAQIMGAVHDVSGTYYGATSLTGHPSNDVGWAIGAGLRLNAPMIGAGDYFQAQVNYAEGATGYVAVVAAGNTTWGSYDGGNYGYALQTDGVYAVGGDIQLTTAWGVDASYEHHWSPHWQTSVYGAYTKFQYNSVANAAACAGSVSLLGVAALTPGCDNDFSYWDLGTRTQFNLDASTYVGLDVVYQHLTSASAGLLATLPAAGSNPAGLHQISDQSAFVTQFRIHRNFYP